MEEKYFVPLTIDVDDGKGGKRKLYSNSSWMEEEPRHKLFELLQRKTYCCRSAAFITLYGLFEVQLQGNAGRQPRQVLP
jgi:hypothetical protein